MGDRNPKKGPRGRGPGRRPPPPESTGEEAEFLARTKDARTPVAVHLMDGEIVRGVIEYYDRDMIKINRERGGPNVFVRKRHIRYLHEDTEA